MAGAVWTVHIPLQVHVRVLELKDCARERGKYIQVPFALTLPQHSAALFRDAAGAGAAVDCGFQ